MYWYYTALCLNGNHMHFSVFVNSTHTPLATGYIQGAHAGTPGSAATRGAVLTYNDLQTNEMAESMCHSTVSKQSE